VLVGQICTPTTSTNSLFDQKSVLSLVIATFIKDLNVWASPPVVFIFLEMSRLMRMFFLSQNYM
jgi:hypothetical protein